MGNLNPYAMNPSSLAATHPTKRADQKEANNPDEGKETEKKELFPAVALGLTPTMPTEDALISSADFYRYGKMGSNGFEIQPRTFDEFDDDKRTASIRIFGQGPKDNKARDFIPPYTKFFLDSVQEAHVERSQIVETFGQAYIFFHGERPPVYNFAGSLVNTRNANWVADFMFMYNTFLRGTRCTEMNATTILTYGGRQVEGFILGVSTTTNATIEGAVGLSFQVVITERKYLGFSNDLGYASAGEGDLTYDAKFLAILDQVAGKVGKGTSDADVSKAWGQGDIAVNDLGPASGLVGNLV